MPPKIHELRQRRAELVKQSRALIEKSEKEDRDLTPEEKTQFDDLASKVDDLVARIGRLEDLDDEEANADEPGDEDEKDKGKGDRSAPRRSPHRQSRALDARDAEMPDLDGKHKYSLMKVFRHIAGISKLDGLEAEVHSQLVKRHSTPTKGVLVPLSMATHRAERTRGEFRDLTTTTGTGSIANILGTELIDLLRNRMVVVQAGATVMDDMTGGTFSLPKQTAASTAYWVTEGNAPTSSNQTIGQVTFTPKTVGAFTDLSRKFMIQTSLTAEAFAKNDLARVVAIELDRAALAGSGSAPVPQGVIGMTGVNNITNGTNGGAPTWTQLVNAETLVANANADFGKLAWITSPAGRGKLKRTVKDSNTAAVYLWNDDNELNGYPAYATNQVPSGQTKGTSSNITQAVFGNWEALVFAMWGGLDVIEEIGRAHV